ncbi:MAG: TonB family protein [Chitinophagales bacterium]|nr:TonB family protein [Chitinophagales bacterium]
MDVSFNKTEEQDKRKAYVISLIYGFITVLLLILLGFRAPFPPFEEEGIFVNFGNVVAAAGNSEPKEIKPVESTPPPPVEEVESETSEEVVTQEVEETVSIPKPEVKAEKPTPKPKPKETKPKEEPKPTESKPVETTKPKEEPKPEVNEEALFGGSGSSNTSEGNDKGSGNMGQPDGTDGPNYQGQNSGSGNAGIGFSLTGRDMVGIPSIKDDSQKEGKVTLKIKVDRNGKVVSAEYTIAGSTTSDPYLKKLAIDAALKAKFNPDGNAPEIQQGTMTFVFKLK